MCITGRGTGETERERPLTSSIAECGQLLGTCILEYFDAATEAVAKAKPRNPPYVNPTLIAAQRKRKSKMHDLTVFVVLIKETRKGPATRRPHSPAPCSVRT